MNHNEEVPDNLGGLGDLLPADVLKMVNELLEQLHRKEKDHQGSIVLNIYEKGSLHVDHVDTQNFYGEACPRPTQLQEDNTPPTLPPPLSSPEAMVLWQKAQDAGLCGCQLSTAYFPNAGGTAGRCDSGAAGHQGEVEGVRKPLEQEVHAE